MDYSTIYQRFNEFETTAHKKLVKMFQEFNKKFFKGELPEVEIKITNKDTKDSKGVAGSFNYPPEAKVGGKTFKLKDLRKKGNALKDLDKTVYEFIVQNSYIEVPKDCVKKGKYYCAAILLHEMTHEYIELISHSSDTDMHGKDFKKKIDEINKKSNNEYRVPYEEVPDILKSDKPLDKRPEGPDNVNESFYNAMERIYKLNEMTVSRLVEKLLPIVKKMVESSPTIYPDDLYDFCIQVKNAVKCYEKLDGLDGEKAAKSILKNIIFSAEKQTAGGNSGFIRDWIIAHPIIIQKTLEAADLAGTVIDVSNILEAQKQYGAACFAAIEAELMKES